MFKFPLLIVGFIISFQILSAQSWETLNPNPTGSTVTGLSFINADTGLLSCYEGNIVRTHDGGNSWEKYSSGSGNCFVDVKLLNSSRAVIIGNNSSIGITNDCGETWTFQKGPGVTYEKVSFADEQHGFICGWYNTLARTEDAGDSWELLSCNVYEQQMYTCMEFLNKDTGYIAGFEYYYPAEGRLFRTTDGGLTVEQISIPAESEKISAIEVLSYNEIWLCEGNHGGPSRAYHTTDAGLTWQTVILGNYSDIGTGIKFFSPLKGRITGDNSCFVTEDGGQTWTRKSILSTTNFATFNTSDWTDENVGYVVGFEGYIAKTTNSGENWQEKSSGSRAAFSAVAFSGKNTGCAVGSESGVDFIYHTGDGGQTWASVLNSTSGWGWILDIMYASETEVWASGNGNRVYHSMDGGASWTTINPTDDEQNYFYSICPVKSNAVFAGGKMLLVSDDNGQSWHKNDFEFPGYYIRKVVFTDEQNGFISLLESETSSTTKGKLFKTGNGGATWEDVHYIEGDSSRILSMDFINKDTGIISIHDQGISLTTDGGISWNLRGYPGTLQIIYVKMFNEREVVASDVNGGVYYSYNGGENWEQVELIDAIDSDHNFTKVADINVPAKFIKPTGVAGLFGTCFTGMGSGWMCRDGGLIKKYTDLTVSINEPEIKQYWNYQLCPNPALDLIQIRGGRPLDYISVFNSQGKSMLQISGKANTLDISGWIPGVYLVKIVAGKENKSLKFIKQ